VSALNGILTHSLARQCESVCWNRGHRENAMRSSAIYANRDFVFRSASSLLFVAALSLVAACVSPKYQRSDKSTPPVQPINVKFPTSTLDSSVYTEISDGGPGSWKRESFWDEYVVIMRNQGDQALNIASATLVDYAGAARSAGSDPWALERESKTLERRYQDAGITFSRMAAPRVIASAAEPTVVASAGIGAAGAATAATLTAVALPVYGVTVFGINMHNKAAIKKEFNRRRVALPLTLGPGETRTGSFFFPMVPNPQSLTVRWTGGAGDGETTLGLHFLQGLHVSGDPR
jgi:hypothetical protein